jgi:tectonin beta-propeller repeat-containing protein 1
MEDARYYYVYENQRWNPLTGFTTHGLPTDRYSWSDRSGKISLTKDSVKLATIHWQWTSDWLIDFQTPGGVDHDGWQYATDFPASYHHKKRFTDYVRRRRWARKCKLTTSGPWRPLGATKLIDLTLKSHPNEDSVMMWAVTAKGEALFRTGVSSRCQEGLDWLHVTSDVPFQSITIGGQGNDKSPFKVWAVATDGSAFLRHGITDVAPVGQLWLQLHPPASSELRNVSAGDNSLWALDTCGRLWFRQEVNAVFPEGTSWSSVACASATGSAFTGGEVKAISACGKDLWAILDNILPISWGSSPAAVAVASAVGHAAAFGSVASAAINATGYTNGGPVNGVLVMRSGITPGAPMGVGWDIVIGVIIN